MKADGFEARVLKRIQEIKDGAFQSVSPADHLSWVLAQGKVFGLEESLKIHREALRNRDQSDE